MSVASVTSVATVSSAASVASVATVLSATAVSMIIISLFQVMIFIGMTAVCMNWSLVADIVLVSAIPC